MNENLRKIYICLITFIITAVICAWVLYAKISRLEFKPAPAEYVMDIEKTVIDYGDSFDAALKKTRLTESDKSEIKKELKNLKFNIGKIKAGEFFEIVYSTSTAEWINFWYYPEGESFYSIQKNSGGTINSSQKTLGKTVSAFNMSGEISSSLWSAMEGQGVPAGIILSFADIFAWQMDFLTDTRQGDTFRVIYEFETANKKNTQLSSKIIAAQYKSGKKIYNAILFKTAKGDSGYFDENGKSVKSAFLKAPLQFRRISSTFNLNRMHPILKIRRPHLGIDYAAPTGTPVSSIADGTVTMAQKNGGYGNYVEVRHSNGYVTSYGHLSKYGGAIKRGARVRQGQIVGYVGTTGLSTGPHLDFRMKKNGKFINFLNIKMPPSTALSGKDKETFNNYKEEIISQLEKPISPDIPAAEPLQAEN
ncbi:MAG: peptidoglycan DD-metalloendopeptidase family protein [Endomicrobium sp.]|jgi:murein DD-endopeptidase MepM/ murein hydrolase activator NlpD|nr:peptidoglycan DD-metalloendopeptidase family protein [Endomicrobium sp.]